MCESVQRFTGMVKALEIATEADDELRLAMARNPRDLARDGVDFSPLSSPISLFEQWCTTWDADSDPEKRNSLAWKRDAICGLVELHAPKETFDEQNAVCVSILTANTSPRGQEWFG